ncbi:MAG: hypothetical protein H6719_10250 [Sandaracinaceae bacterium]|nr:hypothetical protein [Sandaracinaceae bacterium]
MRRGLACAALLLLATACDGEMPPGGCRATETDCGGACVDTRSDARNCGACGTTCGAGEVCAAGRCDAMGCSGGTTECDRACVTLATDERHCGACGNACASDQTCRDGVCGGGGPIDPPPTSCDPPITLEDTTAPDQVVGDGTAASCTHAALAAAVAEGGVITFDCGGDATIDVTEELALRTDVDTIIDGGGAITLDGGRTAGRQNRIFHFDSPDYRRNTTRVVLQRLTLQNAEAPASDFTPQDAGNPMCAWGYKDGEGGAMRIRDGRLHVIDCVFRNNAGASPGPDTGGGAIYALGALEVIVVGSSFVGNEGSNHGALGLLQTDVVIYNSVFEDNQATGMGQNFGGASGCPVFNHEEQGGAGGNAGAVGIDGDSVERVEFCGVTFRNNRANELGTVARTPNGHRGLSTFNRVLFEGNHAGDGGGAIYMQDMELEMYASAVIGNTSDGNGAGVRIEQGPHGSTILIENTTFQGNQSNRALGAGLVFSGEGLLRNCTFAENDAAGGEGFFGAAIVAFGAESQRLRIQNTIFWNNVDDHEWTPMTCMVDNPGAPVPLPGSGNVQWPRLRNGPSMVEDNPCTTDIVFADAMLSPLADNGGPTPTMMPGAGSMAIGLGADCPETDQRGEPRPTGTCAAGAVEP